MTKKAKKLRGSEWSEEDMRLLQEDLDRLCDAGLIEKQLRHDGQMEYRAIPLLRRGSDEEVNKRSEN